MTWKLDKEWSAGVSKKRSYNMLNVSSWYPSEVVRDDLHLHQGLSESLLRVTPLFHDAFIAKHSGNVIQNFWKTIYFYLRWLVAIM